MDVRGLLEQAEAAAQKLVQLLGGDILGKPLQKDMEAAVSA